MKPWSTYEEAFLLDNYEEQGVHYCSKELKRTSNSIVNKASRLGLSVKAPFARRTKSHRDYEDELLNREIQYYPKEQYINARTPITHECIMGHTWKAAPSRILNQTVGCPTCSATNFNPYKPCMLYLVSLKDKEHTYYILGLSTKEVQDKYLTDWNKYSMKLEWFKFYDSGLDAYNYQQQILKEHNNFITTFSLISDSSIVLNCWINKPN